MAEAIPAAKPMTPPTSAISWWRQRRRALASAYAARRGITKIRW